MEVICTEFLTSVKWGKRYGADSTALLFSKLLLNPGFPKQIKKGM